MGTVVRTTDITKRYKDVHALERVNVHIGRGDIYGLIGRNGAGKTTLLNILAGAISQTSGEVELFGEKNAADRSRIGALIEAPGIYPEFTALENLRLKATALGIRREGYLEGLLDLVGLGDVGKRKAGKFSLGMRQRLGIALALVGDPDLLLLDEPTNGMDPQGIQDFRIMMQRLNKEHGITIIISSHILDELAKTVTRVGIIDSGRLVQELSLEELEEVTRTRLEIRTSRLAEAITILEGELGLKDYQVIDETTIHIFEYVEQPHVIGSTLAQNGLVLDQIHTAHSSLEEFYLGLTGGGIHA